MKIDGKDLQVIKNMYWQWTAAMQVDGEISSFKKKGKEKLDVRQGFVLSSDFFSLCKTKDIQELKQESTTKQFEIF